LHVVYCGITAKLWFVLGPRFRVQTRELNGRFLSFYLTKIANLIIYTRQPLLLCCPGIGSLRARSNPHHTLSIDHARITQQGIVRPCSDVIHLCARTNKRVKSFIRQPLLHLITFELVGRYENLLWVENNESRSSLTTKVLNTVCGHTFWHFENESSCCVHLIV